MPLVFTSSILLPLDLYPLSSIVPSVPLACDCGSRASSAASAYDLGGRWCSARSSGAEGSGFSDMASDGLG